MAQVKNLIEVSRESIAILNPETLVEQVVTLMCQSLGYEYLSVGCYQSVDYPVRWVMAGPVGGPWRRSRAQGR